MFCFFVAHNFMVFISMHINQLSIKNILFLIVAIIALPAVCIIINSGIEQRRAAVQDAKLETQQLAEAIVSEQKNLIASTQQLFIALSQLPEVKERNSSELNTILINILSLSPQYSNLFIADPSGLVWASGLPQHEEANVAHRRYFINALSSGRFSSGEYNIALRSQKTSLNFGYPIKSADGRITGVICADLSLAYYRRMFDSYQLPKGASVALLDHNGIILGRAVEPEKYVGQQSNREILRYMLEGPDEETSIGASSIVGDTRIQTYRKLTLDGESEPYMYVRAGIPSKTVMAEYDAALLKNFLIYSFALMIGFFLSWLIGKKWISDRILILQRFSQHLADGDPLTPVASDLGGGEIGELGHAFDDMAVKLALREEALRASEKNYRNIFNTTHDALFVNDASGRIADVNQSAEVMFAYSRKELLQMSIGDLFSGDGSSDALVWLEKSFAEGTQELELLSKRRSGESFWAEIAVIPSGDVGERRALFVIRDISARKEIEQMREAVLSSISHEMRTPMTAMLGFLEHVIENRVEEAELREYHTIMLKEGERLNEMITNFLDMQRLKSRLAVLDFAPVEVAPLIESVVALYAGPFARHSIVVAPLAGLPPLLGDVELLYQALSNLLSNAIKYSPVGSEIVIAVRQEDDRAILSVKDQGIGIPPEALDKVFDLFYRVHDPSRRHVVGTGLGLALVREIAATHKGLAWVESIPGEGSIFNLSLPIERGFSESSVLN